MRTYMRSYRKVSESIKARKARREGAEALRDLILQRFEGDLATLELNGAAAAEIIRWIGVD